MRNRTLLALVVVAGCASDPPPTAVTVANTPDKPLVVGSGDTAHPTPKVTAEPTATLDDAPAIKGNPIGAKAPGFTAKAVNGKAVSPFKDRVTVIHFWATWCGPCKQAMPGLQKVADSHRSDAVDVIAVSVDDESNELAQYVKQEVGVTYPVGWDDGHVIAQKYLVQTMPSTYLVDRDGKIRFVHDGYHSGDEEEIAKEIAKLL